MVPGRQQAYKLGMKIRALYNGFLSPNYSPEQIRAYSTDTDRTHMTAQLFLAALFPPKDHLVWNNNIFWHPIPVFTTYLDHWEELFPAVHRHLLMNIDDKGETSDSECGYTG
ncbi:hypothetical protein J6590_074107 [Homalodisca vitripennis]|nr:hypothetical protein J6590_074107 [Homalodisca vitripennis]